MKKHLISTILCTAIIMPGLSSCSKIKQTQPDDPAVQQEEPQPVKKVEITYYNTNGSISDGVKIDFTYQNDYIAAIDWKKLDGSTSKREFTYDDNGRVIRIGRYEDGNESWSSSISYIGNNFISTDSISPVVSKERQFVYDSEKKEYRVFNEDETINATCSFDDSGNLTKMVTPSFTMTKNINQQTKGVLYGQHQIFVMLNILDATNFSEWGLFDNHATEQLSASDANNTYSWVWVNETSADNHLTNVRMTAENEHTLFMEAAIIY